MGTKLAITSRDDTFMITANGGYVPKRHVMRLVFREEDFVAVAERFLNVPYLWGGKSALGIDCSGLVQVSLQACGVICPRDSDMQEKAFTKTVVFSEIQRGDLIFWKGHVAIARDAATMIHANAFHMMTAIEPIAEAIARIKAGGSEITSIKRPR